MASRHINKIGLSKSILEMKFMKKTKEKIDKETYQQEGEEYFGTQKLPKRTGKYITESSYAFCGGLIEGRLSFHGENPEIERIMELEALEKPAPSKKENEVDISDADMARAWKNTTKINVKTINKRNLEGDLESHPEPRRKKPKFLKPVD